MSAKPTFSERMARAGYDPHKLHPDVTPPPRPVYLGRGEWGPPDSRPYNPDDDQGYGPEDDEFIAELLKDEPPVAAPERPWYDRDG